MTGADLLGKEVKSGNLPGVGTKLVINGNLYRIVYTKPNAKPHRFTAEHVGKYEYENG